MPFRRPGPAYMSLRLRAVLGILVATGLTVVPLIVHHLGAVNPVGAGLLHHLFDLSRPAGVMLEIGLVLAAIIVGYLSVWSISRPLVAMRKVLDALAVGSVDIVIPDRLRGDEIGDVARALEHLRQRMVAAQVERAALAKSDQRWAFVVESTGQGLWEYDFIADVPMVSPQWERNLGYEPGSLVLSAGRWQELIHPDDLAEVLRISLPVAEGEVPYATWDCRMRHADGHWVWIQDRAVVAERLPDGRPRLLMGLMLDRSAFYAAQQAAQDAEARWKFALNGAKLGVWDVKLPEDDAYHSDQFLAQLGLTRGERPLKAADVRALVHPDDVARVGARLNEFRLGNVEHVEAEYRMRHANGEWRWFHVQARVMERDAAGAARRIIGTHMDITSRVTMEETLRRSEGRLKQALDAAGLSIWDYQLPERRSMRSDTFYAQLGLTARVADATGFNVLDLVHPEDRAECEATFVRFASGKTPTLEMEHRMRHADGSWRWMQARGRVLEWQPDGRPRLIIGTQRDVTQHRALTEQLRIAEERWAFALDSAGQGVWDRDFVTGRTFVSKPWLDMLGLTEADMDGGAHRWTELIHPDDLPHFAELDAAHVRGETSILSVKLRMRHRDGHWIWVLDRGKVIARDANGAPLRAIGTHEDITEMVRIEDELRIASERAEAAARAKSDFLSNMSHELRTPLTGILSSIDFILAEPDVLPPHLVEVMKIQREAGRSLLQIVNDILDFSKLEKGRMELEREDVSIDEVLGSATTILLSEARRKSIVLRAERSPDVPAVVIGDEGRLRQVLLNFLSNALKFTPDGGQVSVLAAMTDDGRLRFEVTDTGVGIEEARLPHLFERFTQADSSISRRYGGTGLGLAISRRLVELMGGELEVRSVLGQGSTFSFIVPCIAAGTGAGPVPAPRLPAAVTGRATVLLAEDNALNRLLFEKMLVKRGYRVLLAVDGEDVLRVLASAEGASVEIVLMDVQMPGVDGLEATRRLRADVRCRHLPVIALTANTEPSDMEACFAAGMNGYAAKPVNWETLVETIERLLPRADASATA